MLSVSTRPEAITKRLPLYIKIKKERKKERKKGRKKERKKERCTFNAYDTP
jgi:hypothetical protein